MNPKVAATAVKMGFGLLVTVVLGAIVRMEQHVDEKIEAHYDRKHAEEEIEPDNQ